MNSRIATAGFFLALLLVAGCNGGSSASGSTGTSGTAAKDKQGKKLVIGFSQIGAESAWRTAETKSVKDEAQKRGIDLKFADGQQKIEDQIRAVRQFIQQKVDGIIIAPVVESGWTPVLKEAKAAHIPVILADRSIDSPDNLFVSYVGSDFVQEGQRAAQFMAKALNGKGNMVELEGTPGASAALDRKKGFDEEIAKSPGIKILMSQSGNFTRAEGKQTMEAFLKAQGKNINAVFAHNDDMALGAVEAIEAAGLKPGKDIVIVSIDGTHDGIQAVADGKINCVIECKPLLGPSLFDNLIDAINGKTPPKKVISKEEQFDISNAAKELPGRQY